MKARNNILTLAASMLLVLLTFNFDAMCQNTTFTPPNMGRAPQQESVAAPSCLSAPGRMLYTDLQKLGRNVRKSDTEIIQKYALMRVKRHYEVSAILTVGKDFDESSLKRYKVGINTRTDGMMTATIPTKKFRRLADAGIVKLIDVQMPVRPINKLK